MEDKKKNSSKALMKELKSLPPSQNSQQEESLL